MAKPKNETEWQVLTGDVDYLTHGGSWWRMDDDKTALVVSVGPVEGYDTDDEENCRYQIHTANICLNDSGLEAALRSCGWSEKGGDSEGNPITNAHRVLALIDNHCGITCDNRVATGAVAAEDELKRAMA